MVIVSLIVILGRSVIIDSRSPLDSILDATSTVSPNRQYRGMVTPTTPARHGPGGRVRGKVKFKINIYKVRYKEFPFPYHCVCQF